MLILYKATIQKKIITLHPRLQENRKMHKGMRTRTVLSVVIKKHDKILHTKNCSGMVKQIQTSVNYVKQNVKIYCTCL